MQHGLVSTLAYQIDIQTNQLWLHKWLALISHFLKTLLFFLFFLEPILHMFWKNSTFWLRVWFSLKVWFLVQWQVRKDDRWLKHPPGLLALSSPFWLSLAFYFMEVWRSLARLILISMSLVYMFPDIWSLCSTFFFEKNMGSSIFWWIFSVLLYGSGWIGLKGSIFLLHWTRSRKVRRGVQCALLWFLCWYFLMF